MPSFHDMWMDAYDELASAEQHGPMPAARAQLSEARELIDEENSFKTRQQGGYLIREVRQECRRVREAFAA